MTPVRRISGEAGVSMMRGRTNRLLVAAAVFGTVVFPLALGPPADAGAASSAPQEAREVRTIWTSEFGVARPAGLAYVPGMGELLVAGSKVGSTRILRLGFDEDPRGTFRLSGIANPATLAYDTARRRLTAVSSRELVAAAERARPTEPPPLGWAGIAGRGLRDPQGASFDASTGTWFILDAGTIVEVDVNEQGRPGTETRTPVASPGQARFRGIAFDPLDGLIYVTSPEQELLYGLDGSGTVVKTYSLASLGLHHVSAMTFAPSSDPTDDARTLNLFIADAGSSSTLGGVMEVTLATVAAVSAPTISAALVQTIATSAWNPASPDPSGIVYLPGPDRLQVVDSEVDETTGAGYHGVNLWQTTRGGGVTGTGTTLPYSKEPTGLGHDPGTNTLFISDDAKRRVWVVKPGSDGRFGSSDDVVTFVDAGAYGSTDTEDPEFDPTTGHLFFLDGVASEVYDINPVNGVFGDGNDLMTHFDVGKFGPTDWEGLGSDPVSGTLLVGARKTKQIFEITKTGSLVRIIDASGISGMKYLSGLAMAPASNGTGQRDYWIVDRAIDNGPNPNENDGRIFEISVVDSSAPSISGFSPTSGSVGTPVTISGSGFTGATNVKFNGTSVGSGNFSVDSDVQITATVPSGATTGPISVTTPGGIATSSTVFTVTGSSTLTFGPVADTFVRSDNPTLHPGTKISLSVDNNPIKHGLLKFSVSGVGSGSIQSVKLRLFCLDASDKGGDFYRVADNSWQENTVTWNTEPAADPTSIASLGAVSVNTWYEVDLNSLVTGDGTYSIRIASTSGNGVDYSTKEGAAGSAPQLVVTLAS